MSKLNPYAKPFTPINSDPSERLIIVDNKWASSILNSKVIIENTTYTNSNIYKEQNNNTPNQSSKRSNNELSVKSFKDILCTENIVASFGCCRKDDDELLNRGWIKIDTNSVSSSEPSLSSVSSLLPTIEAKITPKVSTHLNNKTNKVIINTSPDPSAITKLQSHWFQMVAKTTTPNKIFTSVSTDDEIINTRQSTWHSILSSKLPSSSLPWISLPNSTCDSTCNSNSTNKSTTDTHHAIINNIQMTTLLLQDIINSIIYKDNIKLVNSLPHSISILNQTISDYDEMNLLHISVMNHNCFAVNLLLQRGMDVDSRHRKTKKTAVLIACEVADVECIEALLAFGACVTKVDKIGQSILHKLCNVKNSKHILSKVCLKIKQSKIISIDHRDKSSHSAIMLCTNLDNAIVLLSNGADPTLCNKNDLSAISLATLRGDIQLLEGILLHTRKNKRILLSMNNISQFSQFRRDKPIIVAAMHGQADCLQLLIDYGCHINCIDEYNRTPLIYSILNSHETTFEKLLRTSSDINSQDIYNNSAAVYVLSSCNSYILERFLSVYPSSFKFVCLPHGTVFDAAFNFTQTDQSRRSFLISSVPIAMKAGVQIHKSFLDKLYIRKDETMRLPYQFLFPEIPQIMDVVFTVEDDVDIYSSRVKWLLASPYFYRTYKNDFDVSLIRVVSPHFSMKAFRVVNNYILSGVFDVTSVNDVNDLQNVSSIASKMELYHLSTKCDAKVRNHDCMIMHRWQNSLCFYVEKTVAEFLQVKLILALANYWFNIIVDDIYGAVSEACAECEMIQCQLERVYFISMLGESSHDIILISNDGVEFRCNRGVICKGKFASMIHYYMTLSYTNCSSISISPITIILEEVSAKHLAYIISSLYNCNFCLFPPHGRSEKSVAEITSLLLLADYFLLDDLRRECEQFLSCNVSPSTSIQVFLVADSLSCIALKTKAIYTFFTGFSESGDNDVSDDLIMHMLNFLTNVV